MGDAAARQDNDAIDERRHRVEVVGHDDHDAAAGALLGEELREQRHAGAIEAGERLVGQQQARLVDERARDGEPLQHAARVGARGAAGGVAQADAGEQRVGGGVRVGDAVEACEEDQVLVAGQIAVAVRLVGDDADGAAQLVVGELRVVGFDAAAVAHAARRRRYQRRQDADQRRLAGAVWAEERRRLAGAQRQVHSGERALPAVHLRQPTRVHRIEGHRSSSSSR